MFGVPPSQPQGPPTWASELINYVRQIKVSLNKLDEIERTVNQINMKVTDLETKVNRIDTRGNEVERSYTFISGENDDRRRVYRTRSELTRLKDKCNSLEKCQ